MQTKDLLGILVQYDRFKEIAVNLQCADTVVTHIEETDAPQKWKWVFITEIRFSTGYVSDHLQEAFVQAMVTHLGCNEEWEPDFFNKLNPEERMSHLKGFEFEYHYEEDDIGHSLGEYDEEQYVEMLQSHCGASDFAKRFFSLYARKNETVYIGSHGCTPCWDYMTISGDSILMTTLSVVC